MILTAEISTPETSESTESPQKENIITNAPTPSEISSPPTDNSNISEEIPVDPIVIPELQTSSPTASSTFSSTSLPVNTEEGDEISTAEGSSSSNTDIDISIISGEIPPPSTDLVVNVNLDEGALPAEANGAAAAQTSGVKHLCGSANDVLLHASLCLLCIFILSLR